MTVRTLENRVVNWTGTVHYAAIDGGGPCCSVATHKSWMRFTRATVTCKRCIAMYGEDEQGHEVEETTYGDEHVARRAAERAERQRLRRLG